LPFVLAPQNSRRRARHADEGTRTTGRLKAGMEAPGEMIQNSGGKPPAGPIKEKVH
jgi:hypothetical protein